MSARPSHGGIFGFVPLAFRELRLSFASRASLLRHSGIDPVTGRAERPGVRTDAASLARYVRLRRTIAWLCAGFGVLAPLAIVASLAVFAWWPNAQGDAIVFGIHLGLGGSLVFVLASIFGMLAASLLVKGLTRDLEAKRGH